MTLKNLELESKSNKELIGNKKFEIKNNIKTGLNVLKADISDLRRITPIESTKTCVRIAYMTALFPGVGQLVNKQYIKSLLFFLMSFFIYFIAIPYSLGYGNFQGTGISGLITLAEGGRRIDKSLIFMIEGIIAIYLLIFAIGFIYISFRDVLKVEKAIIKGIRPKNWFETKTTIVSEGFPYMVSTPAIFLIVFVVLVPVTTALLLSFTGMDPQNQSKFPWVGLSNYRMIALGEGLAGSVFWLILFWTLIWTLFATSLAILIGFTLAILANNDRVKGKKAFRIIYLLPWAVPGFITVMFFSIMLSPNAILKEFISGIFNQTIHLKNKPVYARTALI